MLADDPDLRLARSLFQDRRIDVARLQALLAQAQAGRATGGPPLARLLVEHGLLPAGDPRLVGAAPEPPPALAQTATSDGEPEVERIGDYRLLRVLGRGGMGEVFEAQHVTTGMRHALKVMTSVRDATALERFRREGAAQARVDAHPAVVRVHQAGEGPKGAPFLVMDLCPGGSLADRLKSGPLAPEEVRRVGALLARGLAHVHRQGVLHRDLKPGNVLFDGPAPYGAPRLVDFGLARAEGDETLTRTGAILGTPAYMAPEQARGGAHGADARADVYGLGAVLYHALAGRPPYEGAGLVVLSQVARRSPPPPRRFAPDAPPELEAVILRAMARRPEDRFPDADALALALDDPPPVPPGRGPGLAVGLGLALLLAAAAWVAHDGLQHVARREQALVDAALLAAETSSALALDRPLATDAALPAAWRERRAALAALVQAPALDAVEADARALEGLVALAAGRPDEARRAADALPPGHRGLLALRGALPGAPVTDAERDLEAAVAQGLRRPEVASWLDEARVRRVIEALQANDPAAALRVATARASGASCPPALPGAIAAALRACVDGLARGEAAAGERARAVLALALAVRADLPRELGLALLDAAPGDWRLAAALAAAAQDDRALLRRVAGAWQQVAVLDPGARREAAEALLPAARRAVALAPDDAATRLALCALLDPADAWAELGAEAHAVMALRDPTGVERAQALAYRGLALAERNKPKEGLKDLDAALLLDPAYTLGRYMRASARWALRRDDAQRDLGVEDALAFVREVDLQVPAHEWPLVRATLIAWSGSHDAGRPGDARPAMERLVEHHDGDPVWAGWRVRLAVARMASGDEPGARAMIARAAELLPRNERLADLAPRARAAATARSGLREKLDDLAASVGRRRRMGDMLP